MPPSSDVADWRRLKLKVQGRMRQLGYESQTQLADAMDMSRPHVAKIFSEKAVGETTLVALDDALLWETGSSQVVLRGGEPVIADETGEGSDRQRDHEAEQRTEGSDFVRQLRTLRTRSKDRESFVATILMLVGEAPDAE